MAVVLKDGNMCHLLMILLKCYCVYGNLFANINTSQHSRMDSFEVITLFIILSYLMTFSVADFKGKLKVKVTLQQATKAQRWSRGIALLFL
jgi:hypothetical protein